MFERPDAIQIMNFPKGSIFQRVKQYDLAFEILHKAKQQVRPVLFIHISCVTCKEFIDNADRAQVLLIPFFAIARQQRQ